MKKQVILYYAVNGKWDGPLEAEATQKLQMDDWVATKDWEVVGSFVEDKGDEKPLLEMAFAAAHKIGGTVLVSSACRVASKPTEFLKYWEDEGTPLAIVGIEIECYGEAVPHIVHAMLTIEMLVHERYLSSCEKWLT